MYYMNYIPASDAEFNVVDGCTMIRAQNWGVPDGSAEFNLGLLEECGTGGGSFSCISRFEWLDTTATFKHSTQAAHVS